MLDFFKGFVINRVPGPLGIGKGQITYDIRKFRYKLWEVVNCPSQSFNTFFVLRTASSLDGSGLRALLVTTWSINGWFQKISMPYHWQHPGIQTHRGRFLGLEFWRHGGKAVWNSKRMGGFSSVFPEVEDGKSSKALLEIAGLITFPACKSSTNQPRKQGKDRSGRG